MVNYYYHLFHYCQQCTTSGNLSGRVNNTDKQGLLIIIIIYFITVTSVQPLATSPEESITQISRDCQFRFSEALVRLGWPIYPPEGTNFDQFSIYTKSLIILNNLQYRMSTILKQLVVKLQVVLKTENVNNSIRVYILQQINWF